MKARPILFSGDMVRAMLDGRKTMTRRIVKPQPDAIHDGWPYWHIGGYRAYLHMGGTDPLRSGSHNPLQCPYGRPGDVLYVNEAWRTESDYYNDLKPRELSGEETILYDADADWSANHTVGRYRHARFMPKWASRITLLIEDVRVERLQEISEADAMEEGAEPVLVPPDGGSCPHRQGFLELWESLHGSDSWPANPFVWRIQFRPILQNVDAYMSAAA